jgi:anti-sigma B factor antagonist
VAQEANVTMQVRTIDAGAVDDIKGEVTASCEQVLMDAYNEATASGARSIVLNFSGLEYMNSSGIGLLVTVLVRANRSQQRMFAVGLNEHYRQIFQLTRLDEAIGIFEDENDALAAAGAS